MIRSRILGGVALWVVAVAGGPAAAAVGPDTTPHAARIVRLAGDVSLRDGGDWRPAHVNEVVAQGAEVHTGIAGAAILLFVDRSVVVVHEMTQLRLDNLYQRRDKVFTDVLLRLGEVQVQAHSEAGVRPRVRVRTPLGAATVRDGDVHHVSYYPPVGMEAQLLGGDLVLEAARGRVVAHGHDVTRVLPTGVVRRPGAVLAESSRIHVEPRDLTMPEVDQIESSNQPKASPPGIRIETTQSGSGSTLVFRFVLQ